MPLAPQLERLRSPPTHQLPTRDMRDFIASLNGNVLSRLSSRSYVGYRPEKWISHFDQFFARPKKRLDKLQFLHFSSFELNPLLLILSTLTGSLRSVRMEQRSRDRDVNTPSFVDGLAALSLANPHLQEIHFQYGISASEVLGGFTFSSQPWLDFEQLVPDRCSALYPNLRSYRCFKIGGRSLVENVIAQEQRYQGVLSRSELFFDIEKLTFISLEDRATIVAIENRRLTSSTKQQHSEGFLQLLKNLVDEWRSQSPPGALIPDVFVKSAVTLADCFPRMGDVRYEGGIFLDPADKERVQQSIVDFALLLLKEYLESPDIDTRKFLHNILTQDVVDFTRSVQCWPLLKLLLLDTRSEMSNVWCRSISRQIAISDRRFTISNDFISALLAHPAFHPGEINPLVPEAGCVSARLLVSCATAHRRYSDESALGELLPLARMLAKERLTLKNVTFEEFCKVLNAALPTEPESKRTRYIRYCAKIAGRQLNAPSICEQIVSHYKEVRVFCQLIRLQNKIGLSAQLPGPTLSEFLRSVWIGLAFRCSMRFAAPSSVKTLTADGISVCAAEQRLGDQKAVVAVYALNILAEEGVRDPKMNHNGFLSIVNELLAIVAPEVPAFPNGSVRLDSEKLFFEIIPLLSIKQLSATFEKVIAQLVPLLDLTDFVQSLTNSELFTTMMRLHRFNMDALWEPLANVCSAEQLKQIISGFATLNLPNCLCAHYCKARLKFISI